jgi:hypothetical protein
MPFVVLEFTLLALPRPLSPKTEVLRQLQSKSGSGEGAAFFYQKNASFKLTKNVKLS